MKDIMKHPILYGILAIYIFAYVPGLRVYILVIFIVLLIAINGKNGFVIYFAYSSLGAFLNVILSFLSENTNIYKQIETSVTTLTVGTMGSIIDAIFYSESLGWNGLQNFIAFIIFGGLAFVFSK